MCESILSIYTRRPAALTEVRTTSRLYWIGQYEALSKKWEWFFQFDLAPAIGYSTKRVVGEGEHTHNLSSRVAPALGLTRTNDHTVTGVIFFLDGLLVVFSLSNFLGNLAVLLLVRSAQGVSCGAEWGVYFGVVTCAHVIWYSFDGLVCVISSTVDRPDHLS